MTIIKPSKQTKMVSNLFIRQVLMTSISVDPKKKTSKHHASEALSTGNESGIYHN